MIPTKFWPHVAPAAAALLLCSCASVSVKDVAQTTEPAKKPRHIYIETFAVDKARMKENPYRKNKGALASDAQRLLGAALVDDFTKLGIPAVLVAPGHAAGTDGLVISGRITRLEEGSRLLRMGLGLGFGGTKMETAVEVRNDHAPKSFLTFATTGGSNATPGAATNPIPFSAAPTALLDSKEGVSDDAARTGRQITAVVGGYLAKHGWVDAAKVPKEKTPGSL